MSVEIPISFNFNWINESANRRSRSTKRRNE